MLFNLLLIRPFRSNSDKSPLAKKQPAQKLNKQEHLSSKRHHQEAIESLQQFKQRYYLERKVF